MRELFAGAGLFVFDHADLFSSAHAGIHTLSCRRIYFGMELKPGAALGLAEQTSCIG